MLALNGVDGTIRQRFIAPLDGLGVAANAFNQHAHVMVADLSGRGSGSPNVVANGAVWDAYGNLVSNRLGVGTYSLALAKLDDSGQISIISQELGLVVARHADGTVQWQSPIYGGGNTDVPGNLSVADLDGDGSPEIMTTLEGYLFVYDAKGQIKWIHHYADAGGNRTIDQFKRSAAFDLDGDGIAEVIVPTTQGLEFTDGVTGKTKAIVSWPDLGVTNTGYLGDTRPANTCLPWSPTSTAAVTRRSWSRFPRTSTAAATTSSPSVRRTTTGVPPRPCSTSIPTMPEMSKAWATYRPSKPTTSPHLGQTSSATNRRRSFRSIRG